MNGLAGQPGESQGFDHVRIGTQGACRGDFDAAQLVLELRHQRVVVRAAAANIDPVALGLLGFDRHGQCACAEQAERGLHVLGGKLRQAIASGLSQPGEMKVFAAGAFRWRLREIRIGQQTPEQFLIGLAARRPGAALVVGFAQVLLTPLIHQTIAGTGVETDDLAVGGQQGNVGDAADVGDHAVFTVAEYGLVKGGDQWRTLAADGHVGATEIGDHIDARVLGQPGGIADLQGEGRIATGAMTNGLAVTADGAYIGGLHVRLGQKLFDPGGVEFGQQQVGATEAFDFAIPRCTQLGQFQCQGSGHVQAQAGKGDRLGWIAEIGEDGIETVQAGAGHEADVEFLLFHAAIIADPRKRGSDCGTG